MGLNIGPIHIKDPVILAPMSGVTDMPFRRLVRRMGVGLVVSEMIASQAMIRQTRQSLQMAQKSPEESPMAVQLAGCEPHVMAEAAKLCADMGAHMIDINMGCPVKKVVNGYAGSALMRDELTAARIIEATVKAVELPVTLKMRTGWDDQSRNAPRLAKIAEECGVQMVTVHGRTRCQLYNGRADWAFIRQVKESVRVPVIGNGDVNSLQDVKNLLDIAGVDGVMIGRGAYGRPWFLNQACHYLRTGEILPSPCLNEQKNIVLSHVGDIVSYYGEYAGIRIARKHVGWYSKGLSESAEFRVAANQTESSDSLRELIAFFYESKIYQECEGENV